MTTSEDYYYCCPSANLAGHEGHFIELPTICGEFSFLESSPLSLLTPSPNCTIKTRSGKNPKSSRGSFQNDLKKSTRMDGTHSLSDWREEAVLCSIFTVEGEHFTHICGQERARYPDTANTFSTTGYLITSIAACSPTTPITHPADRSGTYSIKWNALGNSFNRGLDKLKPPGNL